MYRSGLVPRRMALFGLVGGPLVCLSGIALMFGAFDSNLKAPHSSTNGLARPRLATEGGQAPRVPQGIQRCSLQATADPYCVAAAVLAFPDARGVRCGILEVVDEEADG